VIDDFIILSDLLFDLYTRRPFRPFVIVTKLGVVHRIDNPEALRWRDDRPIWLGIKQADLIWEVLDTHQIIALVVEGDRLYDRLCKLHHSIQQRPEERSSALYDLVGTEEDPVNKAES
jgi:hypothetical protein